MHNQERWDEIRVHYMLDRKSLREMIRWLATMLAGLFSFFMHSILCYVVIASHLRMDMVLCSRT